MNDDSKQKAQVIDSHGLFLWFPGRGERIRTSGLYVPNVALYQAKLHPEVSRVPIRAVGLLNLGAALQKLSRQL